MNKFNISMTCGYDEKRNELSGWGVEISNDKYNKETYIKLDELIVEYYMIKIRQKLIQILLNMKKMKYKKIKK